MILANSTGLNIFHKGQVMKFEKVLVAEKDPDLVSQTIMDITHSKGSHIMIMIDGKILYHATGEHECCGEVYKGVHKLGPKATTEYMKSHVIVKKKTISPLHEMYAIGWLDGNCGKGYSQSQFAGFIPNWKWMKKLVDNDRALMICSELTTCFEIDCCGLVFTGNSDYITPEDAINL